MPERLVLGVDLGSSSAKAVLADETGRVLAHASVPQSVDRPVPGAAEQDPETWWAALRELVAATLSAQRGAAGLLAGISISGHFPTLVLTDEHGRPLAPARLYADRRADAEVDAAATLGGEALAGDEWLPKLLSLRTEAPSLLDRARMVFNPHDHVAFRLTGERGLDHRSARRSGGLFDPVALAWRSSVCAAAGVDAGVLPPLRRAGEVLGRVTLAAAHATGLPVATPVVVGLGDTPAELIGAGVTHPGTALLYYGTTTTCDVSSHPMEAYLRDPRSIVDWAPYHEVAYAVIGPALPWVAAALDPAAAAGDAEIGELDAIASRTTISPNSAYVLPYFHAHARPGTPVRLPTIVGLDAGQSRADLHLAILESFGFTARAGLEAAGLDARDMRCIATGGGARSGLWRQLTSDILGSTQEWRPASDAALGSAALAAWATCGADVFGSDWGRSSAAASTLPRAASRALADERYRVWLRLRDALLAALN